MRAPSLPNSSASAAEPVGLLAAQVRDAAQPARRVGEQRDRGQGRHDLAVVAEVEIGAVQLLRAGDLQLTRRR